MPQFTMESDNSMNETADGRPCRIKTSPLTLRPGSRFGHYEILAALGAGGMGEVYRARRTTRLGRDLAIKVLSRKLSDRQTRCKTF